MKSKLFVFLFFSMLASGQEAKYYQPPSEKKFGSMNHLETFLQQPYSTQNQLYPKNPVQNLSEKYKDADFDYTSVKPKRSVWDRLKNRLSKLMHSIFGDVNSQNASGYFRTFLRIAAMVIIALVLYFLLRFLLDKDGNFIFGKKNRKVILKSEDLAENIHEIRFADVISGYELKKDFRNATRYQFLQILKKLSDRNIINWEPEKTNKDYVADIKANEVKREFSSLAYVYENVWYGEFDIDEESYGKFKSRFSKFIS